MKAFAYGPIALGLLALLVTGCGAASPDVADDPAITSDDAELIARSADDRAGAETGTSPTVGVAAAPSCTATSDGGKWCCAPDATGQLKCWKVDPPPPPDTIATRAPLKAKVLSS